jgi:acyl carrier protein phosphodiesterase
VVAQGAARRLRADGVGGVNYLAHLFLADDDAESLIGNLAGDFVKGPLRDDRFTAGIRDGIARHRRVDAFTDSHPEVLAFRKVISAEHGHYAQIISDVFFDHFLACDWERYSPRESLEAFAARVFKTIDPHADALPGRLAEVYPRMREGRWLTSYRELESIATALHYLSFRLSRKPRLEEAVHHLVDSRTQLAAHFHAFFPQLLALR